MFSGSTHLTEVNLPSTLTGISNYAFQDCTGLVVQVLPSSVTSISDYAFSGCYNLRKLYVSENLNSVGTKAFDNTPKLSLYCPMYCWATEYALANNIPFVSTTDEIIPAADSAIDYTRTFYAMDLIGLSAAGTFDFTLEYAVKEELKEQVSDLTISLFYPTDSVLVAKSLKIGPLFVENYIDSEHELSFSAPIEGGRIRYSVKPDAQLSVSSYASISYRMNGETHRETVGIINETLPVLTIDIPESIGTSTFTVSGLAVPMAEIKFRIGDTELGSTYARRNGKYAAEITIPNPQDYTTYTVTATSVSKDNLQLVASADIQYAPAFPQLTNFTMVYNGAEYDLTDVSTSPIIIFSNSEMAFDIQFTNPDRVEKIYVVSERNNVRKYMEATWDESRGSFYAKGYFDPDNRSYVPGTISVQYQKQGEGMSFTKEIDYSKDPAYVNTVDSLFQPAIKEPSKYLNYTQTTESSGERLNGVLELPTLDSTLEDVGIKFDLFTEKIPSWLNPQNATSNGYQLVENDAGEQLYMKIAEDVDDKFQGELIDFIHEKAVDFTFEHGWYGAEGFIENAFAFNEALSTANKLIKWDNNRMNIDVLEESILNSKMSDTEKRAAMEKVDQAKKLNNSAIAIAGLTVVMAAAGITLSFPVSLILPALAWKNSHELDSILAEFGMADASESSGVGMNFRWKIDPSGYVYEAVVSNRLQGVKATAYYQDENGDPVLWNAEEWDQKNPVYTDAQGRYAWDVPEGLWLVKYELEGYETAYSDWLPVVPPQTDVNTELISYAVPVVESVLVKPDHAEIRFSKYMDPTNVSELRLLDENGNAIPFELAYRQDEQAEDGTVYAREYTLNYTGTGTIPGKPYKLEVPSNLTSYAGIKTEAAVVNVIGCNADGEIPYITESYGLKEDAVSLKVEESTELHVVNLVTGEPVSLGSAVTWTSSNEKIATVDANGKVNAVGVGNATIHAQASNGVLDAVCSVKVLFHDVSDPAAYYYNPVYWAVDNGITSGKSPTTFAPFDSCTRAQVMAFLYKASGSPEVSGSNPFTDVKESDYFYKPVLWAVENKITSGTSATTFSPYNTCTRAQVMAFLYKAKGSPEVSGSNPFTDVKESDYFYKPVLWAVANGITNGTSATTFSPYNTCTRAQVMTFLYKAMG